jgi:hypothetical protein
MKKYLSAVAIVTMLVAWNAKADSGSVGGALPPNTWTNIIVNRCMLFPWSHGNNNRVTMLVYPEPFTPGRFLWTTDDAMVSFVTPYCAYDHSDFWVTAPTGQEWVVGVMPVPIGAVPQ